MSIIETAFHALVADYLDAGRDNELLKIERAVRKGRTGKERAQFMIVFAKARIAHPAFGKHSGLSAKTL